ncbi:acyltransferase [Curtobacterium sp. NPDC090217]|uniref:acyltransferase n=1 Tax=Curtobacterium sp. NPDC090217 TaxID=3363970 RepID=UPI0037FC2EE3
MIRSFTRTLRLDVEPPLLAVGRVGSRAFRKLTSAILGAQLNAPGSFFGPRAEIRGGRQIDFGARFSSGSDLWLEAVASYEGETYSPHITIGDDVSFSNRVHISAITSVTIGTGCLIGSGVYISDHNHGRYSGSHQSGPLDSPARRPLGGGGPITIGQNVWIGDNAALIGPLRIGDGAVIGANSVVTRDVPAGTIVGGVPARPLKTWSASDGWVRI